MSASATALPATAYEELRRRILAGDEAPGATVTEAAVATRFGIARPTARQAIDRLVRDGLLRRGAHRAARVPELTSTDIRDIFDSRAVIESAAVALLAGQGEIPASALAAHRALLRAEDDQWSAQADVDFHRALVAGQPSERLARMHASLMGEIELCIAHVHAHHLLRAHEGREAASGHPRRDHHRRRRRGGRPQPRPHRRRPRPARRAPRRPTVRAGRERGRSSLTPRGARNGAAPVPEARRRVRSHALQEAGVECEGAAARRSADDPRPPRDREAPDAEGGVRLRRRRGGRARSRSPAPGRRGRTSSSTRTSSTTSRRWTPRRRSSAERPPTRSRSGRSGSAGSARPRARSAGRRPRPRSASRSHSRRSGTRRSRRSPRRTPAATGISST